MNEAATLILIIEVIVLIIVFIVKAIKNEGELNQYKKMQEQQNREMYYQNRNYKAKDSSFYLMTEKQKLEWIYDNLPENARTKVFNYAENLLKGIENMKYEQK